MNEQATLMQNILKVVLNWNIPGCVKCKSKQTGPLLEAKGKCYKIQLRHGSPENRGLSLNTGQVTVSSVWGTALHKGFPTRPGQPVVTRDLPQSFGSAQPGGSVTDQDTGISGHIGYPTRNLSRAERWGPRQLCLSAPQALSHPVHCPSSPCCVYRINSHRIHYCIVDDPFLVLGMSVKDKARTDVKALPRTEWTVGTRATW